MHLCADRALYKNERILKMRGPRPANGLGVIDINDRSGTVAWDYGQEAKINPTLTVRVHHLRYC